MNNIRKSEYATNTMTHIFKSFSDPTRLRILHLLANRGPEMRFCDLVTTLGQPQGTVSRHLTQLRHMGIVQDRREGAWMHYMLSDPASKLHGALLNCLRVSCDEEMQLADDLKKFDELCRNMNLVCSGSIACLKTISNQTMNLHTELVAK